MECWTLNEVYPSTSLLGFRWDIVPILKINISHIAEVVKKTYHILYQRSSWCKEQEEILFGHIWCFSLLHQAFIVLSSFIRHSFYLLWSLHDEEVICCIEGSQGKQRTKIKDEGCSLSKVD